MSCMPTVAERLRGAREGKNLSVYEVAEATKIKTDHIRALDLGNYATFSAPVYIRGFVRSYAKFLKLDVPTVMTDLENELRGTKEFAEPPPLTGPRRGFLDHVMYRLSKLSWKAVVAILVVGLLIFVGFRVVNRDKTEETPEVNLGPGFYQGQQGSPGETLPLPPVTR